jgi:citrate lyase subunit beta / citryl-CoA lyase
MQATRSLLFVPANRQKMLEKSVALPADALIFDLEDTVPPAEKPIARDMVRENLPKVPGRRVWVRVNSFDSGFLWDDLDALVGTAGLAGFLLPKAADPAEIAQVDRAIAELELRRGCPPDSHELLLLIESARGVLFCYQIVSAARRVASVVLGCAEDADLCQDLGCAWSIDGPEIMYARQHTLLAARAARIAYPLDGVFANLRDPQGFERECMLSRRIGYKGRTVIHPSQVEVANRVYAPTAAEIDYYSRVLEGFASAVAQGSASTTVDGKLIDEAMAGHARRMLAWADALKDR